MTQPPGSCRRQHKRVSMELPIVLITTSYGTTTIASARTTDLSESGMGIVMGTPVRAKQSLSIELKVPLQSLILKMQAEVRHHREGQVGVEFTSMSPHQREQLLKLLD